MKANLPPIVKCFHKEDELVTNMPPYEVGHWRRNNFNMQVKRPFVDHDLRPIPNPILSFEQTFENYPEMLDEIYKEGFKQPSPLQSQSWPIILKGEDMIAVAQTGAGKMLAFLLPAFIHIDGQVTTRKDRKGLTVLILAPTRELVLEIHKEVTKYPYKDITSGCMYIGPELRQQVKYICKGVDIVIATPNSLKDLIVACHIKMKNFSYIVLDEVDTMLNMGLQFQLEKLLSSARPDRQTIMTSSTWSNEVQHYAKWFMQDPFLVYVDYLNIAGLPLMMQKFMFVDEDGVKEHIVFNFIWNMSKKERVVIFCEKKATATHITSELCKMGMDVQSLCGDGDHSDRKIAIDAMVDSSRKILVATDVAVRGICIPDSINVVNFDFP